MPEGPECHARAYRLNTLLTEHEILDVVITGGRHKKKIPAGMGDFIESIERDNPIVKAVGVKGKMLYFVFSNGKAIISTFGLSGNWVKSRGNHCDMALKFDSITLWFQDQLHYGNIKFTDAVYLKKRLSQLGPDTAHGSRDITKDVWGHICKRNQKSHSYSTTYVSKQDLWYWQLPQGRDLVSSPNSPYYHN